MQLSEIRKSYTKCKKYSMLRSIQGHSINNRHINQSSSLGFETRVNSIPLKGPKFQESMF